MKKMSFLMLREASEKRKEKRERRGEGTLSYREWKGKKVAKFFPEIQKKGEL